MSERHDVAPDGDGSGVSRRDAIKKGALIGGAAFVIPVVGSLSMSQASAQTTSGGQPTDNGGFT